ncbi:MAG: hypothetical protein AAF388_23445 [Bacteroidota bacterium]
MQLFSHKLILVLFTFTIFACGGSSSEDNEANASKKTGPKNSTVEAVPEYPEGEAVYGPCEETRINLAVPVKVIADNITAEKLDYNVEQFSDCSGIFHRFLDSLELRCPSPTYPNPKQYRSSRELGLWYYQQGKLVLVKDPLNMHEYIKPGAVMFYGPRGVDVSTMTIDELTRPGGINHVGVIVEVKKDDDGVITGYTLFHGQRPGKKASSTNYHKREYKNRSEYPPYGNGTEQWVAVAPIISG